MVTHKAKMAFLITGLVTQPLMARYHDDQFKEGLKTAGIIGGIVAGACAIGAGISYLCTPSNENLIENGHSALHEADRYQSLIHYFESRRYALCESDLTPMAQTYMRNNVAGYHRGLCDTVNRISRAENDLHDRMHSLNRKGEGCHSAYRTMDDLVLNLGTVRSSLEKISHSLNKHLAYFELQTCVADTRLHYDTTLQLAGYHANNRPVLTQYLKEHIVACSNARYPVLAYIDALDNAIHALEKSMQRCSHNYDLIMQASRVHGLLSIVRSVIKVDDRYAFEVQAREQARREEERLRIERERACAAQRQAEAAQRQADAVQRQVWEMERQNNILREQNRIARERMERHRYCNHHACVCDMPSDCPVITIEIR